LQRLAKPASDKFLQNTSGGVLSWEDSGGGVLQCKTVQTGAYYTTTVTGFGASAYEIAGLTFSITPSAASSYIMVTGMITAGHGSSYRGAGWITYNHSGISYGSIFRVEQESNGSNGPYSNTAINTMFHPNTTNAVEIKCRVTARNSSYPTYINGNNAGTSSDADDGGYNVSSLTAWEIAGSITPSVTNTSVAT